MGNDFEKWATFEGRRRMTEALRRIKLTFIALIVALLAAAFGYQFGQASSAPETGRQIGVDVLNHEGKGKACEPRGNYGHVKNPPKHCS